MDDQTPKPVSDPHGGDDHGDPSKAEVDSHDEPALELESEPPGPDDPETFIEPADPPDDPPADEQAAPQDASEAPVEVPRADPRARPLARRRPRQVIAFASGKGGVGKSLLAGSVGVYLAQLGKKVVLIDASLGSATLHTMVGVRGAGVSLQQFISREIKALEDVVIPTPFPGLGLISGLNDGIGAANPRPAQKNRLLSQLRSLDTDYVIVDLAPGCGYNVLDFFLAADLQVVLTTPEPTSIETAFRLLKSAFLRQIRGTDGLAGLLESHDLPLHCGIPTPHQLHGLASSRPALQEALHEAMRRFKPQLLVSQCRAREDLELGPTLAVVGRRHLGLPLDYIGHVVHDDAVWVTMKRRRPLQVEFPEAKVCKDIDRITRRLLSLETKEEPTSLEVPATIEQLTHYEVLGIHPGATDEEVRRAHRHQRRLYDETSNVIYGVAPLDEREAVRARIEAAHALLLDPDKRRAYDQSLFPEMPFNVEPTPTAVDRSAAPAPADDPPVASPPAPPVKMPKIDAETEFTGGLLRTIREATGIELRELADQTKISITYLRAIEEEDFVNTPAPVYLRGFVKAVAKCYKLDADRVAQTYMARYEQLKTA